MYVFRQWIKSKLLSKSWSTNLITALKSFSSLRDQGGEFLLSLCYLFDLEPHSRLFLQFLMILKKLHTFPVGLIVNRSWVIQRRIRQLYWPTHSFCEARGCRKRCSTKVSPFQKWVELWRVILFSGIFSLLISWVFVS